MLFLNNAAKVCKVFNNLQIIMGKFFIFLIKKPLIGVFLSVKGGNFTILPPLF